MRLTLRQGVRDQPVHPALVAFSFRMSIRCHLAHKNCCHMSIRLYRHQGNHIPHGQLWLQTADMSPYSD